MNKKGITYTAFVLLGIVVTSVFFLGTKNTEVEDQASKMSDAPQIYPVPIPSSIAFANEQIPLDKFQIKERLDRELLVNTYWQSNTMLVLKRTKRTFNVIEPILAQYGVPDDFKYLAVAESGLLNVTSPAGAKGVWQFMSSSGKSYGLTIDDNVDERYNLEQSTIAACKYLNESYQRFGSWSLAAASYNRGMSGISRDIAKQLVSDYYDLHLNTETSRYMLRILAYKTLIENPIAYGFHIEDKDYYGSIATMDIEVDAPILNIAEYAIQLGTNYHVLKTLNPWIKRNELDTKKKAYTIKAPLQK